MSFLRGVFVLGAALGNELLPTGFAGVVFFAGEPLPTFGLATGFPAAGEITGFLAIGVVFTGANRNYVIIKSAAIFHRDEL